MTTIKYRVLRIAVPEVWDDYDKRGMTQYRIDSENFPKLIERLGDESDLFVLNMEDGNYYSAGEFFYIANVKEFKVIK